MLIHVCPFASYHQELEDIFYQFDGQKSSNYFLVVFISVIRQSSDDSPKTNLRQTFDRPQTDLRQTSDRHQIDIRQTSDIVKVTLYKLNFK